MEPPAIDVLTRLLPILCLLALPVAAQNQVATRPSFEVAAIAPVQLTPAQMAAVGQGALRIGMNVTERRVEVSFLSLGELLVLAYRLKPYQISGPEWLYQPRFNIQATIPSGATREQVPEMLQALLIERFGLIAHRESREIPVYALVVGKDGPKLGRPMAAPQPEPAPSDLVLGSGDSQVRLSRVGPGAPTPGVTMTVGDTVMVFTPNRNGSVVLDIGSITTAEAARLLTFFRLADRPVIDRTDLSGEFSIRIEASAAEAEAILGTGMAAVSRANPAGAGLPAGAAADPSDSPVFRLVERAGLKLDSRRAPVETLVVDRVERNPTPN